MTEEKKLSLDEMIELAEPIPMENWTILRYYCLGCRETLRGKIDDGLYAFIGIKRSYFSKKIKKVNIGVSDDYLTVHCDLGEESNIEDEEIIEFAEKLYNQYTEWQKYSEKEKLEESLAKARELLGRAREIIEERKNE